MAQRYALWVFQQFEKRAAEAYLCSPDYKVLQMDSLFSLEVLILAVKLKTIKADNKLQTLLNEDCLSNSNEMVKIVVVLLNQQDSFNDSV